MKLRYPNKSNYDIQIPMNIFQTWHSKKLPVKMYQAIKNIKKNNPRFKHFLFDDAECRAFIKDNFDFKILNAYDKLIPGAYKADLWRYCVLYKYGGIYMDIKYYPINGFKLVNLLEEEQWVLDVDNNGIYNALMVCKPNNEILWKAINQIADNVMNKYYGSSCLEPTGPLLLAKYFTHEEKIRFKMRHILMGTGTNDYNKIIKFNNFHVFQCYNGYFKERSSYSIKPHYSELWKIRAIYL
jgi:mannosyltransferase OCH1-like enzyme